MIRKTQFAVAVAALISAPAFAAVGWDANIELDTTYQNTARDNSVTPSVMKERGASQSGRVELNAFSKTDKGGGFVAGRASLIAIQGSAPWWEGHGFQAALTTPALDARLTGYGSDVRYMSRRV